MMIRLHTIAIAAFLAIGASQAIAANGTTSSGDRAGAQVGQPSPEIKPAAATPFAPGDGAPLGDFDFKNADHAFSLGDAAVTEDQSVLVPLPATAGAGMALLACYAWGSACRRWRRQQMPES